MNTIINRLNMNKMFKATKSNFLHCLLLLGFMLFIACSKTDNGEKPGQGTDIKEFKISTSGFSNISSKEVKLTGKIEMEGDEPILDHGFIIQYNDADGQPLPEETVSLGKTNKTGEVSGIYKPKKPFENQVFYSYYFYVRTAKNFYKGSKFEFSLSNLYAIAIEDRFSYGTDTVKIEGNFEGLDDKYRITVRGALEIFSLPFTVAADKKSITFKLYAGENVRNTDRIQVSIVRKDENSRRFELNLVKISYLAKVALTPRNYDYLSPLSFYVVNIADSYQYIPGLYILINGNKIQYGESIRLADVPGLSGGTFKIGYMNGRDSVYFAAPLVLEQPDLTHVLKTPSDRAHPNSFFTSIAPELSIFFWAEVNAKIGGKETQATYDYRTEQLGLQTPELPDGEYELKVYNRFYNYISPKKLKIEALKVSSSKDLAGYVGDTIKMTGNFIKGMDYYIMDENNFQLSMGTGKEGSLEFDVTPSIEANHNMQIAYAGGQLGFVKAGPALTFKSKGFTIDKFYPMRGTTGDVLTIEGEGIGLAGAILLGDVLINPIKINNNKISFSIPRLSGQGKMKISFSMNNKFYQSTDYFEYF